MHNLQMYEGLRDMLEKEIKEIEKQGNLNAQSLDELKKLMATKHYVSECIKEEEGGMSSYGNSNRQSRASYRGSYEDMSGARRGRDGDGDGRYSEEGYSRGRSYESSYRNSRDGAKQAMLQKLEMMMDEPIGENERLAIMDCINKIR